MTFSGKVFTDWECCRRKFSNNVDLRIPLKSPNDLEEKINYLNTYSDSSLGGNFEIGSFKNKMVQLSCFHKKGNRRKAKSTEDLANTRGSIDKNKFNNAAETLKRKLKGYWFDNFTKNLNSTEATVYSLWKSTKNLKRPVKHIPHIQAANGAWAKTLKRHLFFFQIISLKYVSL